MIVPLRRLAILVPELSSTYEPPVLTVSAVLLLLNAPEPWRRKTPPFTVVLGNPPRTVGRRDADRLRDLATRVAR